MTGEIEENELKDQMELILESLQDNSSKDFSQELKVLDQSAVVYLTKALLYYQRRGDYYFRQRREAILSALRQLGGSAVAHLSQTLIHEDLNSQIRQYIISVLGKIGEPSLETIVYALKNDEDNDVRAEAVKALGEVGEPALDALVYALRNDRETAVRAEAARALGEIGEPALDELAFALRNDEDEYVRTVAISALVEIGEPAVGVLKQVGLEHTDRQTRMQTILALSHLGLPARFALATAIEDYRGDISQSVIKGLSQGDLVAPSWFRFYPSYDTEVKIESSAMAQAVRDELILRTSGRPSSYFNAQITAEALQALITRSPRLIGEIQAQLCDVAYEYDDSRRIRTIAVARILGATDFANLVKAMAHTNEEAADAIMDLLGGNEAVLYFRRKTDASLRAEGARDETSFRRKLYSLLTKHFNEEELKTLCFILDVDYDHLRGEGSAAKVRELIMAAERNGRLKDLVEGAADLRSNVRWPKVPPDMD
jgi:hypothetical protein